MWVQRKHEALDRDLMVRVNKRFWYPILGGFRNEERDEYSKWIALND